MTLVDPLAVGQVSVTRWQTVGRWLGLVVAVWVGRWLTGPTFGYTLFALTWTPIAAVYSSKSLQNSKVHWLSVLGIVCLTGLPWLTFEPILAAGRLGLILLTITLLVVKAWGLLRSLAIGTTTSAAVISIVWLAWFILPVTMASQWVTLIGDTAVAKLLAVHPLINANTASLTAGDWTHQAIAYRCLTRLGQDLPFEWPASVWPCLTVHLGSAALLTIAVRIFDRLFHAEQLHRHSFDN